MDNKIMPHSLKKKRNTKVSSSLTSLLSFRNVTPSRKQTQHAFVQDENLNMNYILSLLVMKTRISYYKLITYIVY